MSAMSSDGTVKPRMNHRRVLEALSGLILGMFVSMLASTVVSTSLPVIIHDREAHGDSLRIVCDYPGLRGVFHCFSGSVETAREYLKMGFYISVAGPVTFPKSVKTKEVAKAVPLDRLLVETDSPYLTPQPFRGKRNEPAYVRLVAEEIANLRDISLAELAEATTANVRRLFNIP